MYTKSARLYDVLYSFQDYQGMAAKLVEIVRARLPSAASILDVACGTGKHLEQLRGAFQVAGLDINPDLLAMARARCPRCPSTKRT